MDISKEESSFFKFYDVQLDETRLNVLFCPFRPKSLDYIAWESKHKFWSDILLKYLIHSSTPFFSINSLKLAFQKNNKSPACLDTVIEELKRSGDLVIATDVDLISEETSLLGWLAKSIYIKTVEWTIGKIKYPFSVKHDPGTFQYLHLSAAKNLSSDFYLKLDEELKGKLVTLKELAEKTNLKEKELKIIIKLLIQEKKAAATCISSEIVVKFAKGKETQVKLCEIDIGKFQLEKNENLLSENLSKLEGEKESALQKVKDCLKSNRKQSAKTWLRRTKELEKYIDKRCNALENIRCLLDKLKNVESDSLVLQSYKLGMAALKDSMAENGLTEDNAESTMNELQEVLDVSKEVEDTLSRPLDDSLDVDLESELAAMLADEESGNNASAGTNNVSFDINKLPSVPEDHETKKLEDRLEALAL